MDQSFKCHASSHRTIANNGNALSADILKARRYGHPQSCANGRAGVTNAESVVWAFCPFWKSCKPVVPADAAHLFPAPGKYFVGVGLMTNIPYQAVFRGIEYIMHCNGQFQHTQTGTEVATSLANRPEQKGSELSGQLG